MHSMMMRRACFLKTILATALATSIGLQQAILPIYSESIASISTEGENIHITGPEALNYQELVQTAQKPKLPQPLQDKIHTVLNTPFIYHNSEAWDAIPVYHQSTGPALRAASWNIERGFHLDNVIRAFTPEAALPQLDDEPTEVNPYGIDKADEEILERQLDRSRYEIKTLPLDSSSPKCLSTGIKQSARKKEKETNPRMRAKLAKYEEEREWLSKSQVLLLTEVDNGMKRTSYQDVTRELAEKLHMNAAYGVEFLELAPLSKRVLDYAAKHKHKIQVAGEDHTVDPTQYLGMHGSAVLTRYPILNVEMIRLPDCYDWYKKEQRRISQLEKVKRSLSEKVFLETMLTEVRKGGRMAMAVDLSIPELPEKKATFVVAHFENRCESPCRRKQLVYLLDKMKNKQNPVVFGGDFNTSGFDVSPTSVAKEIRVRLKAPDFWARTAIGTFVPFGYAINAGLLTSNFLKKYHNPATPSIPLLLPNPEYGFFRKIRGFRFADGTKIDLRGRDDMAYNGRGGFMANSNQRELKGFVPTFEFERLLAGVIGRYKLDWFLVKGYLKPDSEKIEKAQAKEEEKLAQEHEKQAEKAKASGETTKAVAMGESDDNGDVMDSLESDETQADNAPVSSRLFAPHFARTLVQVSRYRDSERLSDHTPITIDLPLTVPPAASK